MRIRTGVTFVGALGVGLTLTLSGCAAVGSAGSGAAPTASSVDASSPVSGSPVSLSDAVPSSNPPASGANPPASSVVVGTGSTIPSAPGTAGSAAQPPLVTVAPVTSAPGVVATPLPDCNPTSLKTLAAGKIRFTTGETTTAPWFAGDNPANGQGYEAAVAAAVAKELGYSAGDVSWTRSDLADVVAGKGSGFDVALGEFPTPDEVSGPVDYTTGYFSISDSVVAAAGSPAAAVSGVAGLKPLRVGAIANSTGISAAKSEITGKAAPSSYASAGTALAALRAGAVDAVVVPTTAALSAGSGVVIVGQLTDPSEQPQQLGMVLAHKSPLTACVSAAIDQLRVTGVLSSLLKTWVPAADKPLS